MDTPARPVPGNRRPSRAGARRALLAVAALLAALGVGFVAFGRFVDDFEASVALQLLWFGFVALGVMLIVRRTPALRAPLLGTLAVCALAGAFVFYWTTIRDDTVNETVATGVKASELPGRAAPTPPPGAAGPEPAAAPKPRVNVELASGSFASLEHETSGGAAIVDLADGGRRLTLTDLRTDNGPDLFVYLVPRRSNAEGSIDGGVSLGRLKGNIGSQQYEIPSSVRLGEGASVVVWCRAFTVAFGVAELEPS